MQVLKIVKIPNTYVLLTETNSLRCLIILWFFWKQSNEKMSAIWRDLYWLKMKVNSRIFIPIILWQIAGLFLFCTFVIFKERCVKHTVRTRGVWWIQGEQNIHSKKNSKFFCLSRFHAYKCQKIIQVQCKKQSMNYSTEKFQSKL
jgi:hypothetical protein